MDATNTRTGSHTCCEHYGVNCHQGRQCPARKPAEWLTPRRFWVGYAAAVVGSLLAVHFIATP